VKDDITEQEHIQTIFLQAEQEIKDGVAVSSGGAGEKSKKKDSEMLAKKQQELEKALLDVKEQSDNRLEDMKKTVS
jgi:50S ribosomal subunit-associated GTPase HflX